MNDHRDSPERDTVRYRVEVAGALAASWPEWFAAEAVRTEGQNTVLELRVADQSELLGRLRRVHDLNLRLISVTWVPEGPSGTPTNTTKSTTPKGS